jgi:membrane protein YdbS with pleckstrin-like domain
VDAAESFVAPVVADGEMHSLDPRWIPYRRKVGAFRALIGALIFLGAAWLTVEGFEQPALPVFAAAVLVTVAGAVHGQWWPSVAWRYERYRLTERALEIRRGVLWRRVIDVPRSRIQHTDVSQGPFERMHSLGTLSVHTAGILHAVVRLHGLEHARALAIREHLVKADDDDVV